MKFVCGRYFANYLSKFSVCHDLSDFCSLHKSEKFTFPLNFVMASKSKNIKQATLT